MGALRLEKPWTPPQGPPAYSPALPRGEDPRAGRKEEDPALGCVGW